MSRCILEKLRRSFKGQVAIVVKKVNAVADELVWPPSVEALEVWRGVRSSLPATITPIPDEHLVAIPIVSGKPLSGVTIVGEFGPGSWLFRDRRHLDGGKLEITRGPALGSPVAEAIIVFSGCGILAANLATTKVRVLGRGSFAAFGYLRRFPGDIAIGDGGRLEVGDNTSTSGINMKVMGCTVTIGRDCQIGGSTKFLALSSHTIVDLSVPDQPAKMKKLNRITVGDHVWLGEDSRVVSGAQIGDGSILGAYSVVASKVPENCVAVGNPARVVRRERTWSRANNAIDSDAKTYIERSLKKPASD